MRHTSIPFCLLLLTAALSCDRKAVRLEVFEVNANDATLLDRAIVRLGTEISFRVILRDKACVNLFEEHVALLDEPMCLEAGTKVIDAVKLKLDRPGEHRFYVDPGNDRVVIDVRP